MKFFRDVEIVGVILYNWKNIYEIKYENQMKPKEVSLFSGK